MSVLINSANLNSKYNCKVIEFNADATKFGNMGNYWPKKALQGVRVNSRVHTFRNLKLTIHFYGGEVAEDNIIKFIEHSSSCTFKYKNKNYDVSIKEEDDNKPIVLNSNTTKIDLNYDILNVYKDTKTVTIAGSGTININSPKECYANLEITASTALPSCKITINGYVITIKNVKANETVYIGSGKVTAGGKSKMNDVDMWEFPILKNGVNTISIDNNVSLKVKYNERW